MAGILPNPEQACAVPAIINLHDLYACSMLDQQCKTRTGLSLCSVVCLYLSSAATAPHVIHSGLLLVLGVGLNSSSINNSAEQVLCDGRVCQ